MFPYFGRCFKTVYFRQGNTYSLFYFLFNRYLTRIFTNGFLSKTQNLLFIDRKVVVDVVMVRHWVGLRYLEYGHALWSHKY